jgi:hypothetical protein
MATAAAAAAEKPSAKESHNTTIVLTGSTDAVVKYAKNAPGPAVVYIIGNAASRYFGVRTLGTEHYLVNTLKPYEGVRSLDRTAANRPASRSVPPAPGESRCGPVYGWDVLTRCSVPWAPKEISGRPQFFEVQAVGPWTITVK